MENSNRPKKIKLIGYQAKEIFCCHFRLNQWASLIDSAKPDTYIKISARGGATVVVLKCEETEAICIGIAICSPEDQFSKREGRRIATGRAHKGLSKGERFSYPRTRYHWEEKIIRRLPLRILTHA